MSNLSVLHVLVVLIAFGSIFCDKIDPNYSYDLFMKHFNRTYTGEEKILHENIFYQNYAQLIDKINHGQDLKVNNFLDWNQTQLEEFFNYKPENLGRLLTSRPLKSSLYLSPSSYDWRTRARVTPVKDQQFCGSCWAFATTAQYQSLLAIQTNGSIYDLAEQYAVECEKVSSNGCNGGYPLTALELFNKTGIPLESTYPYQPTAGNYYSSRGKAICTDTNRIKVSVNTTKIMHYSNLTTEQIQDELINSGPLTVAVFASHQAFQYVGSSGLINNCPTDGGPDHAVLLVGYNSSHWFIKNSWGPSWGHNGYGYILKSNDCKLSTWVDAMRIQSGSGSTPTPNLEGYIVYNISMSDSKGDGWNGNIIAFKQDGVIVATFGDNFIEGKNYGPSIVRIKNNIQTQIVVAQKGNFTNEVGFVVKNSNGTVVYSRSPGASYEANIIFKSFCPSSTCPAATKVDYTVSLTDAYGDGWNGVALAFRQNNVSKVFGDKFTSGAEYNNQIYTFDKYKTVDVVVSTPGLWTQEIGFIVRNRQGYVVMQRVPGQSFQANTILGSFCPECINLSPVKIVGETQQREVSAPEKLSQNQFTLDDYQRLQSSRQQDMKVMKALLISTICLASCVFLLLLVLTVVILRNNRRQLSTKADGEGYGYRVSSARTVMTTSASPQDTSVNPSSAQSLNKGLQEKGKIKYLDVK